MKGDLLWRLDTTITESFRQARWVAEGIGGSAFYILLANKGEESSTTEALFVLPSGQQFIAAVADPDTMAVDDLKDYLNAVQRMFVGIRDVTTLMHFKAGEEAKNSVKPDPESRIIRPPGF